MTLLTRAVKFPVGFIANAASSNVEGHRATCVYVWPSSKAINMYGESPGTTPGFSSCIVVVTASLVPRPFMNGLGTRLGDSRLIHDHDAQKKEKLPRRFIIYITHINQRYRHFGQ